MNTLKNLFNDSMGGLTFDDLPFLFLQLSSALLLTLLLNYFFSNFKNDPVKKSGFLVLFFITLLTSLVKYSLAFAALGAACILFLLPQRESDIKQKLYFFMAGSLGVLCGGGFVLLSFAVVLLLMPFKRFIE